MHLQYLANELSCGQLSEASESQSAAMRPCAYLSRRPSGKLAVGFPPEIPSLRRGQAGPHGPVYVLQNDRSHRCPRASSFLPCSAWSQALPLVASKKKSTWWSTQRRSSSNRSALSRSTQASTNKNLSRRAFASASVTAYRSRTRSETGRGAINRTQNAPTVPSFGQGVSSVAALAALSRGEGATC